MALTNKTKYAILGLLNMSPMSGYDIKKFSDFSISHFWNENYAHIYPVLKEMEKENLVVSETTQSGGRPPKNIYSITKKGRGELDEWLLQPVEERPLREELLLKLFFSANVPLENLLQKLKAEKEKNQRHIEEYTKIENMLKTDKNIKKQKALPLWLATLSFGKSHCKAVIKWCNETAKSLDTIR